MVSEIVSGFLQAINLIITLNPEVMRITLLSLEISLSSTFLSAVLSIPLGSLIYYHEFFGKRFIINMVQTLYALPTVLAGLLLFLLLSNAGPLGFLGLLFTPQGMILAQMILVMPLITGFTISALSGIDRDMKIIVISLGATKVTVYFYTYPGSKVCDTGRCDTGFRKSYIRSRCSDDNRGQYPWSAQLFGTRVLTTAISLETSQGDFALAIALGIILLGVAVLVNFGLNLVQEGSVWKSYTSS